MDNNENITLEMENNIINISLQNPDHICNCDINDKTIEHCPLCPGAPRPNLPCDASLSIVEIVPKLVFIVPYRDREQQYKFFSNHMKMILEDIPIDDYKFLYLHQNDNREFNRGAMKNIGFLYVKNKYPEHYKDITLVFNDIDTMPYVKNFLNYDTKKNYVKHFYGYNFTLGGIVSIKAEDFENISGFPNFWSWGYEDNLLQKRVLDARLIIDRKQFYPIMDKNIFQMKDGLKRLVNRSEFDRFLGETNEGWQSIQELEYEFDEKSSFINVTRFNTGIEPNSRNNTIHDLRDGNDPFDMAKIKTIMTYSKKNKARPTMQMRL
jgi:hypothetical protein